MLLWACCVPNTLFVLAQSPTDRVELTWGTEMNKRNDGEFVRILEHAPHAYYLSLKQKEEDRIARLDEDLRVSYVRSVAEGLRSHEQFQGMMAAKDNFVVFISEYDKQGDSNRLYAQAYSKEAFLPSTARREIAAIPLRKARDHGEFHITEHFRGSDIICIDVKGPRTDDHGRPLLTTLFLDQDLNAIDEKDLPEKVEIVGGSEDGVAEKALDLKSGAQAFLTRQYPDGQERRGRSRENEPTFTFVLQLYEAGARQPLELPLKVPGKFLQDMKFMEDINGDVLCIGFFGEEGSWDTRGVFFIRINGRTWSIVQQDLKPFSDDFMTQGLSAAKANRISQEAERNDEVLALPLYDLNEMVRRPDGSVIMVAQQFKTWQYCSNVRDPISHSFYRFCDDYYYDGDIIVVSVLSDGTIAWTVKIPKRQRTKNAEREYSRYLFRINEEQVQFLFNDDIDNLSTPPGSKVKSTDAHGNNTIVTLVTIENDGQALREMLYTPEHEGSVIKPGLCHSYMDESILLYTEKGSSFQFCNARFR